MLAGGGRHSPRGTIQDGELPRYLTSVFCVGDKIVDAGSNQEASVVEAIPSQRTGTWLTTDLGDEFTIYAIDAQRSAERQSGKGQQLLTSRRKEWVGEDA